MSRPFIHLLAGLALCALVAGPAAAKKTTIKVATLAPKGSAFHKVLAELADTWKTASDGQVRLKIYPGGVAGDDAEVVRKMRLGTLHGGLLTSGGLVEISKAVNALQLPLAYDSWAALDYVRDKMRPMLEAEYAAKGFVVLAWGDVGWVRLISKDRIVTPEEAGKAKLFVFQGNPEQADLWRTSGFNPTPLPATEITTALQTGLINAVPATAQAAVLMRWHNHVKHITGATWAPFVGALVIEKKKWDAIDPALQSTLKAAAEKAGEQLKSLSRKTDEDSLAEMAKRGISVNAIPPDVLVQWRALVKKSEGIRGVFAPAEFYDAARRHLADFAKLGAFTDGSDE